MGKTQTTEAKPSEQEAEPEATVEKAFEEPTDVLAPTSGYIALITNYDTNQTTTLGFVPDLETAIDLVDTYCDNRELGDEAVAYVQAVSYYRAG